MTLETMPDLLTVEEASRLLRIGRTTAYALLGTGEIPSVRVGKRILIKKRDVLAMVEGPSGEDRETR